MRKKYLLKLKKNQNGTSLLELVVAVGIFVVLTLSVSNIYLSIANSQKKAIATQSIEESLRFAFEMMSKEIRMAQGNSVGSNCASTGPGYYKIFNNINNNDATTSEELYFKNKDGKCVIYKLDSGQVFVERGGEGAYLTPDKVNINNLKFIINDVRGGTVGDFQPSVTIMMEAEKENNHIRMQTTISAREYNYLN